MAHFRHDHYGELLDHFCLLLSRSNTQLIRWLISQLQHRFTTHIDPVNWSTTMPTYLSDIDLSYPYNINAPTIDLGRLPIAYIEAAVERQLTYEKISLSVSATMVIFDYPPIDITALNTHPIVSNAYILFVFSGGF